jgi:hypothetical protein
MKYKFAAAALFVCVLLSACSAVPNISVTYTHIPESTPEVDSVSSASLNSSALPDLAATPE